MAEKAANRIADLEKQGQLTTTMSSNDDDASQMQTQMQKSGENKTTLVLFGRHVPTPFLILFGFGFGYLIFSSLFDQANSAGSSWSSGLSLPTSGSGYGSHGISCANATAMAKAAQCPVQPEALSGIVPDGKGWNPEEGYQKLVADRLSRSVQVPVGVRRVPRCIYKEALGDLVLCKGLAGLILTPVFIFIFFPILPIPTTLNLLLLPLPTTTRPPGGLLRQHGTRQQRS